MRRPLRMLFPPFLCRLLGNVSLRGTLLFFMTITAGTALAQGSSVPSPARPDLPPSPSREDKVVPQGQTSEGDVITVGHSIFIEGFVKEGVAALGGSVVVDGQVNGDVVAFGGDAWLGEKAVVGGGVIVMGGRLYQAPGAKVIGRTLATTYFREEFQRAFSSRHGASLSPLFDRKALLWRSTRILAWFIVAVLVVLFVPVQSAFAMDRFERDFARIAVIGLLALIVFIGLLALFSLMIKIIIGIPLIIFLMLSLFVMWAFGAVTFYLTLGRWVVRRTVKRALPMAIYALLGLVVWSVLSFIPILNLVTPYVVFIFSLGISLATKMGTGRPWFVRTV